MVLILFVDEADHAAVLLALKLGLFEGCLETGILWLVCLHVAAQLVVWLHIDLVLRYVEECASEVLPVAMRVVFICLQAGELGSRVPQTVFAVAVVRGLRHVFHVKRGVAVHLRGVIDDCSLDWRLLSCCSSALLGIGDLGLALCWLFEPLSGDLPVVLVDPVLAQIRVQLRVSIVVALLLVDDPLAWLLGQCANFLLALLEH